MRTGRNHEIARLRLTSQQIADPAFRTPEELTSYLGAVQAQDPAAMKWAIGLRLRQANEAAIEQALATGQIVRTWPVRGTLHVVAAEDVHWILALCAPRMIVRNATRYQQLELDATTLRRSITLLRRALKGGKQYTRVEIGAILERNRIATQGQRLIHIIQHAALNGIVCHGPRRGKEFTFTLLNEWVPASKARARSDAIAELTRRYFVGHGPATVRDFTWWSGLSTADARTGIESVASELGTEKLDGQTYWFHPGAYRANTKGACWLLPAFDEYIVAYADRRQVSMRLDGGAPLQTRGGMLDPVVVIDGQVVATWKRARKREHVRIEVTPLARLTAREKKSVAAAAQLYGAFLGSTQSDPNLGANSVTLFLRGPSCEQHRNRRCDGGHSGRGEG
jgi:hypothetical protein